MAEEIVPIAIHCRRSEKGLKSEFSTGERFCQVQTGVNDTADKLFGGVNETGD
jgi:hypothetical protein